VRERSRRGWAHCSGGSPIWIRSRGQRATFRSPISRHRQRRDREAMRRCT
jgi:hypothetical protein